MASDTYDIYLNNLDPADASPTTGYMGLALRKNDITPSSARRADGDTRFLTIPSEGFWSQTDWAGGYGRFWPADPAMFLGDLPSDTSGGASLRAAIAPTAEWTTPAAAAQVVVSCVDAAGLVWVVVNDGGVGKLYNYSPGTTSWGAIAGALASPAATSIVEFRGDIWIGYGAAASVQRWDRSAAAYVAPATAFKAQVLCAYSSMLFYAWFDVATDTWRLNRFDPENPAAVADLAILPVSNQVSDYVRSLAALGPDLFVACQDSLWKFTSQNGNAGVLVGPVDRWSPFGGAATVASSGYGAVAFQGALVYSSGGALRRHQPGGGAKQIWPIKPNVSYADVWYDGDNLGFARPIGDLVVSGDRLYVVSGETYPGVVSLAAQSTRIYCWTGQGMHWIGTHSVTFSATQLVQRPLLAANTQGYLVVLNRAAGTASVGKRLAWLGAVDSPYTVREASTTWSSSLLDFGLFDLYKNIPVITVVGTLSHASDSVSVALYDVETATSYPLTRYGSFPTSAARPSLVRFSAPSIPPGRRYLIRVTMTTASGQQGPTVYAVAAIVNPVYPVRYGFRAEIPLGTHVVNHDGDLAYPTTASVQSALNYFTTLRATNYPIGLTWPDGGVYYVRINTITIVPGATGGSYPGAPGAPGRECSWVVTLDMQEISTGDSGISLA